MCVPFFPTHMQKEVVPVKTQDWVGQLSSLLCPFHFPTRLSSDFWWLLLTVLSLKLCSHSSSLFFFFFKILFILFLERGEKREKERERNTKWLPFTCPQLGTRPATQARVLTGNRTSDLLVHKLTLNQLSHTSQGSSFLFLMLSSIIFCGLCLPNRNPSLFQHHQPMPVPLFSPVC